MYTLISIFYVALIGITLMIYLKHREVKSGRSSIISRLFVQTDHFFQAIFTATRNTLSYLNKHTFIAIAQWIAYHILSHIRRWYIRIQIMAHQNPHTRKVIDMVRGRGEIKTEGASLYLKRISNQDW